MVVRNYGNPLMKWEEFISKSPCDVILLYMVKEKFTKPLTIAAYDDDADKYLGGKMAITENDLKYIDSSKLQCH